MKLFLAIFLCLVLPDVLLAQHSALGKLDVQSDERLLLPKISHGKAAAGKRVAITPKRFVGGDVHHMLYLPEDWDKNWKENGKRWPIIFEYTGNFHPQTGSTGKIEDAGLGYSLTGGKYIWVTLPYVSNGGKTIPLKWWGNAKATANYAKTYVPQIIEEFGADTNAVFLCGFSRGAIGVNYLGLLDDEVAKLWTGFITHDDFDGVKAWTGTKWGYPLGKYRREATERLKRVNNRPYLVIQNGEEYGTEEYVSSVIKNYHNFRFLQIDTKTVFKHFPNKWAFHSHTDRWALVPSEYRAHTRSWLNRVVQNNYDKKAFKCLNELNWKEAFYDSCTKSWKRNWTLDGKKASIDNTEHGMEFRAGMVRKENASHAVLWTKESFAGDIKIEYEYTKTDSLAEAVTILYVQATGSNVPGYDTDISKWSKKRKVPAMREYFQHMHTYHISYAAFDIGNQNPYNDYIRARRYLPEAEGLNGTNLLPDYAQTRLFVKDTPYRITVIKKGRSLMMQVANGDKSYVCNWQTDSLPPIVEGRIGLRHMWTRNARYKNFKISVLAE